MSYEGVAQWILPEQLDALEHEGWRALVAGNGGAYHRKHPHANAVMAFPSGTLSA